MWFRVICFVAFSAVVFCPKGGQAKVVRQKPGLRISNGEEVKPDFSAPYMVHLFVRQAKQGSNDVDFVDCGATLISKKYVLTAGQCVANVRSIEVLLGSHGFNDHDKGTKRTWGKRVAINGSTLAEDIAIIELYDEIVPVSGRIEPVKLPSRADAKSHAGSVGTAYGWGKTSPSNSGSEVLQEVHLNVVSLDECKKHQLNSPIHDTNVCTYNTDNKGICGGDAGGPLIVDGYQLGIASSLAGECGQNVPNVFVDVTKFFDFIEEYSDVKIREN